MGNSQKSQAPAIAEALATALEPKLLVRLATAIDEATARKVKAIARACGMTDSELTRLMVGRCITLFDACWDKRINPRFFLDTLRVNADQLTLFLGSDDGESRLAR
jgi:hypothetical protein